MNTVSRIIAPCMCSHSRVSRSRPAGAGANGRHQLLPDQQRHRQWRQSRRPRRRRQSLPDPGAGGGLWRAKDLARLSLDPGGRRPARGERARPHRQGAVAECQGRRDRQGCRRPARRQQQPHQADRAERKGRSHQRRRRHAEPPRRADGIAGRRHRLRGRRGPHLQELDELARKARRWSAISTARACATTSRRNPGTPRIPRAARTAAARRPI